MGKVELVGIEMVLIVTLGMLSDENDEMVLMVVK